MLLQLYNQESEVSVKKIRLCHISLRQALFSQLGSNEKAGAFMQAAHLFCHS